MLLWLLGLLAASGSGMWHGHVLMQQGYSYTLQSYARPPTNVGMTTMTSASELPTTTMDYQYIYKRDSDPFLYTCVSQP